MTSSTAMIAIFTLSEFIVLSYIQCNFCLNLHIAHGDMNENGSGCFFSEHSVYCQRQRCSPMTVVSANIRFVPIFEGVPWREGVKQQWGNRKHWFSRLSTLRLRQLWKSGQSYYTVIFSFLSPVHWPQNTWILKMLNIVDVRQSWVIVLGFCIFLQNFAQTGQTVVTVCMHSGVEL